MDNILEIKNLSKGYDEFKLDNVNISLPKGVIMGLIGENGAGKSTTIKLILDIIKKDSGSIKIFGEDSEKLTKELKEKIGVVLDECCFSENLNINDISKIMKRVYKNWQQNVFDKYIKQFNLPKNKEIKDYSKGMKMKLSISVALSHKSEFLILDEATGGLDPVVRDEILDVFLDFIQDENHSIFISSHILSDLEKICDYIAFLHNGKLIFNEPKDELYEKYGMLKCSEKDLIDIDKEAIVGYRKNAFGVEALVYRNKVNSSYNIEGVSIEDIMLFYIKKEGVR